jgi:hypothetical protein
VFEENLSAYQKWKRNLGDTRPWDVLNPNIEQASDEEHTRRFDICKACPELISLTSQCKKCGCIMSLKTKLEKAVCPIGKWGNIDE